MTMFLPLLNCWQQLNLKFTLLLGRKSADTAAHGLSLSCSFHFHFHAAAEESAGHKHVCLCSRVWYQHTFTSASRHEWQQDIYSGQGNNHICYWGFCTLRCLHMHYSWLYSCLHWQTSHSQGKTLYCAVMMWHYDLNLFLWAFKFHRMLTHNVNEVSSSMHFWVQIKVEQKKSTTGSVIKRRRLCNVL